MLQVLCLDLQGEDSGHPQPEALVELIRSELPSCQLELNGQLMNHPQYSGLANFD